MRADEPTPAVGFDPGGWVSWEQHDLPGRVEVRFDLAKAGGAWQVHAVEEVRLHGAWDAAALRRVPLARIERYAQALVATDIAGMWHGEEPWDGDRLFPAVAHLFRDAPSPSLMSRPDDEHEEGDWSWTETHRGEDSWSLDIPQRRPFPDEFFATVAQVYRMATTTTDAPAKLLAEANGVPVTTVNGWVRLAREKGHLPPTRRGKP